MPRNVRNFWIEVQADGVKNLVATGPQAKDGGFKVVIRQRENGGISPRTIEVVGVTDSNGMIRTTTSVMKNGEAESSVIELTTKR